MRRAEKKPRTKPIHLPDPWGTVTITQAETIRWGFHPGSGRPMMEEPGGKTCGDCFHITQVSSSNAGSKSYFKCDEKTKPITHGPGTDIQKRWPACKAWLAMHDG